MSKGKKFSDEIKEQVYMVYTTCQSYRETAKQTGVAPSTVQKWIEDRKKSDPDGFEALRTEKKEEFIQKASAIIDQSLILLEKRIRIALEREDELERLIQDISKHPDVNGKQKTLLIGKLKTLELQKLGEITTAIGTLYDKCALAKGESTDRTALTIDLPKELQDYGG